MSRLSSAGSYRAVLALPHAVPTFGAALVGRLYFGLLPLGTLFTVQHATHSFAVAGATLAAFGLASFLLPLKARLIDRFGQPRVLVPLSIGCAGALLLITRHWPAAVYVLFGGVAGLCAPPLGPAMRATWRTITTGTDLTARAYSLDSVGEEALYLIGPALVGVLLRVASSTTALFVATGLLLVGTAGMVSTSPARHVQTTDKPTRWGPVTAPGFAPVLVTIVVAAVGMSMLITCVAARAQDNGTPAAAGYLEATFALGSVAGGLAWGRRHHRRSRATHLTGLTAALTVGTGLAALAGNLVVLGAVLVATGAALAPLFVVGYLAADDLAPPAQRTEAGTWVITVNNLGSAAGSAIAGALVDHVSPAVVLGGAAGMLAASTGCLWRYGRTVDHQVKHEISS